jgi:putative ABC transport system substrate-binding protein
MKQRIDNSALVRQHSVLVVALCAILFAFSFPTNAQQAKKVFRIGFMFATSASNSPGRLEAFREGLRTLGYVEGKNVVIDYRYAEGKFDSLPAFAAELVNLKADVIMTAGGISTRAAKKATATIPIVMVQDIDPVGNGFISSLARPGGNITGLSTMAPEVSGKQLEVLKEIVPRIVRVVALGTKTNPGTAQALKETQLAAKAFKMQLQYLDVIGPKDIDTVFQTVSQVRAEAVVVLISSILNSQRIQVVNHAIKSRVPVMYPFPEFVEAGGLMSYGVSFTDLYRRAATYVDKILKGVKPADLPVEQPTKFELIINLKAVKQIGLTIPPNVLARADRVIR